jgi:hypothetical protein
VIHFFVKVNEQCLQMGQIKNVKVILEDLFSFFLEFGVIANHVFEGINIISSYIQFQVMNCIYLKRIKKGYEFRKIYLSVNIIKGKNAVTVSDYCLHVIITDSCGYFIFMTATVLS